MTPAKRVSAGAVRWASRWSTVLVVSALLALQVYALASMLLHADQNQLHRADVAVAAPPVVSVALAEEVNQLKGRPFDAHPAPSARVALRRVQDGRVLAALVVDLRRTEDQLLVDGSLAPRLRTAVVEQVRRLAAARGRGVHTVTVPAEASSGRVRAAAQLASGGGFLLGLLISGPVLLVDLRGARRAVGSALAAAVVLSGTAAAVLVPGSSVRDLTTGAALAACSLVMVLVARALDWLAGHVGLWLGLSAHVVLAIPMLRNVDVALLPAPWQQLVQATPTWAGYQLADATANHGGHGWVQPAAVLAAWAVATGVGIGVSWRHQLAEAVRWPDWDVLAGWRWRTRTRLWVSAGLVVVLAVLVLLPPPGSESVHAPYLASQTACIATGLVTELADLNRISAEVRGDGSFEGGDVGADALLQDGRRLLLFGDTLRRADFPGGQLVRNSMLVFDEDCISTVLPPGKGALIPDRLRADGTRVGYWPMSAARVGRPGYDLVTVGAQRVASTGPGLFDFHTLGPALAVFVVPAGQDPQLLTVRDLGPDDADPERPVWGAASWVEGDWLYLYGTATPGWPYALGFSLRVARVHPDEVLDRSQWRYWDGEAWQDDPTSAVELIPANHGVSQILSVFRQGETWYALSKRDEFLGTDVVVWSAPTPWGPFDSGTTVAQLPSDAATGELRYMPLAHPDLLPEPGTVVVSYSRNRSRLGEVIADPFAYRPRFLRVVLPPGTS